MDQKKSNTNELCTTWELKQYPRGPTVLSVHGPPVLKYFLLTRAMERHHPHITDCSLQYTSDAEPGQWTWRLQQPSSSEEEAEKQKPLPLSQAIMVWYQLARVYEDAERRGIYLGPPFLMRLTDPSSSLPKVQIPMGLGATVGLTDRLLFQHQPHPRRQLLEFHNVHEYGRMGLRLLFGTDDVSRAEELVQQEKKAATAQALNLALTLCKRCLGREAPLMLSTWRLSEHPIFTTTFRAERNRVRLQWPLPEEEEEDAEESKGDGTEASVLYHQLLHICTRNHTLRLGTSLTPPSESLIQSLRQRMTRATHFFDMEILSFVSWNIRFLDSKTGEVSGLWWLATELLYRVDPQPVAAGENPPDPARWLEWDLVTPIQMLHAMVLTLSETMSLQQRNQLLECSYVLFRAALCDAESMYWRSKNAHETATSILATAAHILDCEPAKRVVPTPSPGLLHGWQLCLRHYQQHPPQGQLKKELERFMLGQAQRPSLSVSSLPLLPADGGSPRKPKRKCVIL